MTWVRETGTSVDIVASAHILPSLWHCNFENREFYKRRYSTINFRRRRLSTSTLDTLKPASYISPARTRATCTGSGGFYLSRLTTWHRVMKHKDQCLHDYEYWKIKRRRTIKARNYRIYCHEGEGGYNRYQWLYKNMYVFRIRYTRI